MRNIIKKAINERKDSALAGPITPKPKSLKYASLRQLGPESLGQGGPRHCPPLRGPNVGQPGPSKWASTPSIPGQLRAASGLGTPLDIKATAKLIGCSPWTIRHRLIPMGLPHLRFMAGGKLIFYQDQLVAWIEKKQKGGIRF